MFKYLVLVLALLSLPASANESFGAIELFKVTAAEDGEVYSSSIQTLIMMTLLSFLSAAVIMVTPFMRCVIVFGLLRQAIGTMQSPPNQVIIAISLLISFIVMQPTFEKIHDEAYVPFTAGNMTQVEAKDIALNHMSTFWLSATSEEELVYFAELMEVEAVNSVEELPLKVIVPAFVYSELKIAFKIAFLLFVPFLIIDIVVASTLMGMGMMMLSPMIVSLPIKIFAFVILDGWGLITTSLIATYVRS